MNEVDCVYSPVNIGSSPPDGGETVSILGKVRSQAPEGTESIQVASATVLPICIGCTVYKQQCSGMKWTWSDRELTLEANNTNGVYVSASAISEPPPGAPCLEEQIFIL